VSGFETIYKDEDHRFHTDVKRILEEHVRQDMPEDVEGMSVHDFWSKEIGERGV
jgi:hypothetical protein